MMIDNQKVLSLIADMTKTTRCCQQDELFCKRVTFTQFLILDHIVNQELLKLSDLHVLLSVEKSTSTRLIQPLVQQGLVFKEASSSDSRAINLKLSAEGIEIHQELWNCLNGLISKVSDEIPADIREEVFKHVILFNQAIKKVFNTSSCC
jgi:DNA-binding MarR family transcriptional regulator